ncbi:MAG: hypothetical protein LBC70_03545 [Chitinispirillales bacterium]|jgi:hypothetical protein|nr:hypothetical protein [Chitinispirillales bacterium]
MSNERYSFLLFAITKGLVDFIAEKYSISVTVAMDLLYNSKTYAFLEDKDNGIWQFSKLFLFMLFDHEQKTGLFEIPEAVL